MQLVIFQFPIKFVVVVVVVVVVVFLIIFKDTHNIFSVILALECMVQ